MKVKEFFFEGSSMKIVMEYVEGEDLQKYIEEKKILKFEEAIRIAV